MTNPKFILIDITQHPDLKPSLVKKYNNDVLRLRPLLKAYKEELEIDKINSERKSNERFAICVSIVVLGFIIILIWSKDFATSLTLTFLPTMVAVAIYWAFASSYSSKQIIIHPAIELQSDLEKRLRDFKKIEDRLAAIRLREHMSYWLNLSGWQFEKEVSNLYKKQGFNSLVTKGSGDGGVDIVLNKDGVKTLVQCKNHNKAIGPASIRDLFGAMTHEGVSSGIFISSTGYTKGAREFSLGKSIALLDIHDIIRMHNQF